MSQSEIRNQVDARIGEHVMGLSVLGEVFCEYDPECGALEIPYTASQAGRDGEVRPVFLKREHCDDRQPSDTDYFGHIGMCLAPVPFYSSDIRFAMKVVKRLEEANVWTEIQVRGHGARPLVRMGVPSFQWDRYANSVDELPAAICAAALQKDALESIAGLRLIEAKGK